MSSEVERMTKERKITAKTYTKNKTHVVCVYRTFTDQHYACR